MPLVSTKEMFQKALDGGYAIGAFNFNNMETAQAISQACKDVKAPLILQVSQDVRPNIDYHVALARVTAELCPEIPIALHLDHGDSVETCKICIDHGYTSVMIDASSRPFAENVALTRQVVEYAHDHGVVVESELGALAGIEDEVNVSEADARFTHPEEAAEFIHLTGCDSLAIAMGTSHGAYKFKPGTNPSLRFDILNSIMELVPDFPIVLHGASSVPQEYIEMANQYGGNMPGAIGIPDAQLRKAAQLAVCKVNVASDLRIVTTATIREFFAEHPEQFDPRSYLSKAQENMKVLVQHKLQHVFGCAGKA